MHHLVSNNIMFLTVVEVSFIQKNTQLLFFPFSSRTYERSQNSNNVLQLQKKKHTKSCKEHVVVRNQVMSHFVFILKKKS